MLTPPPAPAKPGLSLRGWAHSSTCLARSHLSRVCSNVSFSLRPTPHLSHSRADFLAGQHLLSPCDEHGDITSGISFLGLCICSWAQRSLRAGARGTQHLLPRCPWLLPEPAPPPGPTAELSPARLPALLPARDAHSANPSTPPPAPPLPFPVAASPLTLGLKTSFLFPPAPPPGSPG